MPHTKSASVVNHVTVHDQIPGSSRIFPGNTNMVLMSVVIFAQKNCPDIERKEMLRRTKYEQTMEDISKLRIPYCQIVIITRNVKDNRLCACVYMHLIAYSLCHLFVRLFIHSFIHSIIRSLICLLYYLSIHSLIYSFWTCICSLKIRTLPIPSLYGHKDLSFLLLVQIKTYPNLWKQSLRTFCNFSQLPLS